MTIAVLIPSYNRPEFLPLACESLLRQTYQHWHAYIADDGSASFPNIPNDARFSVQRFPHQGLAKNFNALLKMWERGGQARATWLGDDDMLLPTALADMVEHETADVVFSDLLVTDMNPLDAHIAGTAKGNYRRTCDPSKFTEDFTSFHNNFNMGTGYMSRRVLDNPRFDERFTTGMEDGLWLYSLFMRGITFDHFPIATKYYRIHPGNNSRLDRLMHNPRYAEESAMLYAEVEMLRTTHRA